LNVWLNEETVKLTAIDLFAGCGGVSQGFDQAGFETVFVNELHPVAMGTFLRNRPDTNLADPKNHCFDILSITQKTAELEALARRIRRNHGDIDVVIGGPPCQGYSGIGHRRSFDIDKEEIPSNHLYREMAKFVQAVAPKVFVFENVRGLLNSKWTSEGESGEIWRDVQRVFRRIRIKRGSRILEYRIASSLLLAKDYGVPQNRPRVIMIGIRSDVEPRTMPAGIEEGMLPAPIKGAPDIVDLLSDLVDPEWVPGGETHKYLVKPLTSVQDQLRRRPDGSLMGKGSGLTEQEYAKHSAQVIAKFEYMIAHNGEIPESMRTKKFAQRLLPERWTEKGPTITATSLPDDYVHFSQPRVPTVREWARLQTFPDWYQFEGKRTTGGRRRAGDPDAGNWTRDLPKFTQIGNAVPVLLAEQIALHIRKILDR
jgi:DNA (cytosine-5)-methyltransferase 1